MRLPLYSHSFADLIKFRRHALNACIHRIKLLCVCTCKCASSSRRAWCCDFIENVEYLLIEIIIWNWAEWTIEFLKTKTQLLHLILHISKFCFFFLQSNMWHFIRLFSNILTHFSIKTIAKKWRIPQISHLKPFLLSLWSKCLNIAREGTREKVAAISHFNDNEKLIQNRRKYLTRNSLD